MKTNRLISGIIFFSFLFFIVGTMFFLGTKNALAANEMKAPATKKEMKAPVKSQVDPAIKAHKKMARKAMKNEKIMEAQKALNGAGFKLTEDGMMGKHTRMALRKYQKDNKLKVTGRLDKETMEKLGVK